MSERSRENRPSDNACSLFTLCIALLAFGIASSVLICIRGEGQEEADSDYELVTAFSEGVAVMRSGNRYGFVRDDGSILVPPTFSGASQFRNGLAIIHVFQNGTLKDGIINRQGRIVVEPEYDALGTFSEGLASYIRGSERGYIDCNGTVRIKGDFAAIGSFSEGHAPVKVGTVWGYINHWGEVVIGPQFEYAGDFSNGVARVKKGEADRGQEASRGKWYVIDFTGNVVTR